MADLNHERPLFKVMAAGGGDRVRTIAEELAVAQAQLRSRDEDEPERPRCDSCGSRKDVTGSLSPRCADCRAHENGTRAVRKESNAGKGPGRRRVTSCPKCYVELPVSGVCGFCP
jgi:hypothetical protein